VTHANSSSPLPAHLQRHPVWVLLALVQPLHSLSGVTIEQLEHFASSRQCLKAKKMKENGVRQLITTALLLSKHTTAFTENK
jgi:hypothetical protein